MTDLVVTECCRIEYSGGSEYCDGFLLLLFFLIDVINLTERKATGRATCTDSEGSKEDWSGLWSTEYKLFHLDF